MAFDRTLLASAFAPHLEPGEELRHVAYGVKTPHILLIIALVALAVLPGLIAAQLLTKHFIVGLTNRRLIALRFTGGRNLRVQEVVEYSLDNLAPVKTSTGPIFTHIKVMDPNKPFRIKFHRAGMSGNRENAMAIAAALTARASGQPPRVAAQPVLPPAQTGDLAAAAKEVSPRTSPPPRLAEAYAPGAWEGAVRRGPGADQQLSIKIGAVTRRLSAGMEIKPPLLGAAGAGRGLRPIAEIVLMTGDKGLGLRNLSDQSYQVRFPGGQTFEVPNGKTIELRDGVVIDFGGIEGIVQSP